MLALRLMEAKGLLLLAECLETGGKLRWQTRITPRGRRFKEIPSFKDGQQQVESASFQRGKIEQEAPKKSIIVDSVGVHWVLYYMVTYQNCKTSQWLRFLAITAATYCPSRMAEHYKSESTGGFCCSDWSFCTRGWSDWLTWVRCRGRRRRRWRTRGGCPARTASPRRASPRRARRSGTPAGVQFNRTFSPIICPRTFPKYICLNL